MLLFDIPNVRDLSFFLSFLLKKTSVDTLLLTKAFANVKFEKPFRKMKNYKGENFALSCFI